MQKHDHPQRGAQELSIRKLQACAGAFREENPRLKSNSWLPSSRPDSHDNFRSFAGLTI